jgi:uncharacterized protein (TIGR02246 family)
MSSPVSAPSVVKPAFTLETATAKVQAAQDAWNSRDPERVALAYTPDSEWRNRVEFLHGREEIKAFLRRKWSKELDYRLKKTLGVSATIGSPSALNMSGATTPASGIAPMATSFGSSMRKG